MRRALLAWELGKGTGHVHNISQLAQRLAASGLSVVVALRDTARSAAFTEAGMEVVQAPIWPMLHGLGSVPPRPTSSASMGDMLAMVGLAFRPELEAMLLTWRGIFSAYRIDLVVAEFAPGAALAARGHLPLAMLGTGYSLPPSEMEEFPLLHRMAPRIWKEADVVRTISEVLQKCGGTPIARLPQMFEAEAIYVNSMPQLDPYRESRARLADGPMNMELPLLKTGHGGGIFAYLSPGWEVPQHLVDAFVKLGPSLTILAPSLSPPHFAELQSAGVFCLSEATPFETFLHRHALIIHYGVGGTSSIGLLSGVPQLALSVDIEKELNGEALTRIGVGKLVKFHDGKSRVTAEMIREMANDRALAKRAHDVALSIRDQYRPGAVARFVEDCVRLAN